MGKDVFATVGKPFLVFREMLNCRNFLLLLSLLLFCFLFCFLNPCSVSSLEAFFFFFKLGD